MRKYWKFILAVVGAGVVTVQQLLADGTPWTTARLLLVVLALLGAYTVYVVPNLPAGNGVGTWSKAFVALAVAGVETALTLLGDNMISGSEWLLIAMAVMTAAGVPLAPASDTPAQLRRAA
jgi:hypothetical protein